MSELDGVSTKSDNVTGREEMRVIQRHMEETGEEATLKKSKLKSLKRWDCVLMMERGYSSSKTWRGFIDRNESFSCPL